MFQKGPIRFRKDLYVSKEPICLKKNPICLKRDPYVAHMLCFLKDFLPHMLKSKNFRWLNAVKETKIEFFVRDNSGEKFLTAHAARRNFSEVICRACAVVIHSWFSHLHGKFCVLALRTFSVSSRGQSFPVSLILHQSSLRGASSSIHTPSTHQRISSGCQWR